MRWVARGHAVIDSWVWKALAEESRGSEPPVLTKRELDVLRLLAKGYTNRQIGGELGISSQT